tara:strand:+ start:171 stop:323 length:153 start_codon:yes stop_codon:yes gene_type:complete
VEGNEEVLVVRRWLVSIFEEKIAEKTHLERLFVELDKFLILSLLPGAHFW